MNHPWEEISLADYPLQTVMILGVAGGNGLEHVDPKKIKRVYGVDINKAYLADASGTSGRSDATHRLYSGVFNGAPAAQRKKIPAI